MRSRGWRRFRHDRTGHSDSDIERFREDLIVLKRDVASLIEHTKGSWTKTFRTPPAKLNGAFEAYAMGGSAKPSLRLGDHLFIENRSAALVTAAFLAAKTRPSPKPIVETRGCGVSSFRGCSWRLVSSIVVVSEGTADFASTRREQSRRFHVYRDTRGCGQYCC